MAKVGLSNKKTRKFIGSLTLLIDAIFDKEEDERVRDCWRDLVMQYSMAIRILRKRSEYTDNDIETFQNLIDSFFKSYVNETGSEGVTNYIHMLASGHIKYYMEIHRNLYKYSQQGWESLNSKYKQVFFKHTQRGGNYGKDTGENERSYLFPVMRAFQRELLWISGDADIYFNSN